MRGIDPTVLAGVLGLLSVAISAGVGYLTHRASTKAATANTNTQSRADFEKEAFTRAEQFYESRARNMESTIIRQDEEIAELKEENRVLELEVEKLRDEQPALRRRIARLEEDRHTDRAAMQTLREELAVAKRALAIRVHDVDPDDGEPDHRL